MIQETSAGAQTVFAEAEDCEKVKMGAPQVTIETITVTRPLKVIAFTCCVITVILMVGATSTSDWMVTDEGREGLFMQCINENAKAHLPFGMKPEPGCTKARSTSYLRGCAALCIIGVFIDFFGTVLTCLGLKSTDPNKKYKYYRVSIYALIVAAIAFLLAVIIYPVEFSKDLKAEAARKGINIKGSIDFDEDGIPDHLDDDDDNDGKTDEKDNDDDNDGIPDHLDEDDDNDGIKDEHDGDVDDFDGDGIPDDLDDDDDNDKIPDEDDLDNDNDGINDDEDLDDDNDGILDDEDEVDDDDFDNDGIPDHLDNDDDNDGTVDSEDLDDDGDGVPDTEDNDDDNDGVADDEEDEDDDGDGVPDSEDNDDDNDGIPDDLEYEMPGEGSTVYSFGFGYGATWGSIILLFASVVLLICDRESEEIFYKERQLEEEEEEGGEA